MAAYHSVMKKVDSRISWAIAIFALALAVRVVYFVQVKANFPGWDSPTIDPLYHDLWAKQIASGDVIGSGPFFRAPFYAYFLGFIYAIFGPSLAVAKIAQHLIGALSCLVIFLFADKYFGRKTAIIAGILSALNWALIYHEDELLLDTLLVPLSILIVWWLMKSAEKPSARNLIATGLLLGLASITRPNFLAFIPAIYIWFLLLKAADWKRCLMRTLAIAAGAAILILPVTLRNIIVGQDMVLIASQGGINFYIGNNRFADGATAALPEFGSTWQYSDAEYLAKSETGRMGQNLRQSEVSSFYYRKGIDYILTQPLDWLGLMLRKLDYFWNGFEISNNQNLYFYRRFASVTAILPPLFYLISPLSIIGLALTLRHQRKYWIIPLFVFTYMLTVIAFFVTSRFRLPVLPFLIILASMTFWRIVEIVREKDAWKIAKWGIVTLALVVLTTVDFFGISNESYAMSHFSLGNVYLKKGLHDKALDEFATAIGMAPCVPKAHLNRGVIFFSRNDFQGAEKEFNLELESCHVSAEAHNNLSVLKRLQDDMPGALWHADQAIAQKPNYPEAYVNKILALRHLGSDSLALNLAEVLTISFPDFSPGHYLSGKILFEYGRIDEARREFEAARGSTPANIIERYDLSTIYAAQAGFGYRPEKVTAMASYELGLLDVKAGNWGAALDNFKAATELIPDFADAWNNLALVQDHLKAYREAIEAFKKSIQLDPSNAVAYYNFGLTLGKVGMLTEAADCFRQAIDLNPRFEQAQEKLRLTKSILSDSAQK
jgi:tetratricopeptide (TPR) repeat protein